MVWEGRDVVKTGRCKNSLSIINCEVDMLLTYFSPSIAILGATNPLDSAPGTIRGDYAIV